MLDKMKTFQDLVQESLQTISEIDIFQLKEKIDHNKDIKVYQKVQAAKMK